LISRVDGKRHTIPLLKKLAGDKSWRSSKAPPAMVNVSRHLEKLACYACHTTATAHCTPCHLQYDRGQKGVDWITSANHNSGKVDTAGAVAVSGRPQLSWRPALLKTNYKGKLAPVQPHCRASLTIVNPIENGSIDATKPNGTSNPSHAAGVTLQPHTTRLEARGCSDCHPDGPPQDQARISIEALPDTKRTEASYPVDRTGQGS
jgi:hypothetical protein